MDNNIDVHEELKIKNQELYINKLIIDLDSAMESLLLFYDNYCDTISKDVINKTISFIDNLENQDMINKLVNTFFNMYKNELHRIIKERMIHLKEDIQNIENLSYIKKLNEESRIISNQISEYYHENIYMLIDEIMKDISNKKLEFKDYLLNSVYLKLINTLRDKLIFSMRVINNNYDESTTKIQDINTKTLN